MPPEIALYIHFPFCLKKCHYCSFVSNKYNDSDVDAYLPALKKEIARRASGERVRSIYLGGGTPSLLSLAQLKDLFSNFNSLFSVNKSAEITLEANPGTVDSNYLKGLKKVGVNRLSLGIQSFNDDELAMLGRIHSAADAKKAADDSRISGFTNVNLDLIYGLPGQTINDWRDNLSVAIELDPEHLSLYALTLDTNSTLQKAIDDKSIPAIDPDLSADQYELAEDLLLDHGYCHYEISNWAKPGKECHHNLAYWQNTPYIGAGLAAHSYMHGHRLANTKNIDQYLASQLDTSKPILDFDEEIDPELQLAETVILGLRLGKGISVNDIQSRFDINLQQHYIQQFEELAGLGLLELVDSRIRLTRRGRLLSNEVFWRFLPN